MTTGNHKEIEIASDGYSFEIKDLDAFSKLILPLYFGNNNEKKFFSRLNRLGFRKVDECKYSNSKFRLNDPELPQTILTRKKQEKSKNEDSDMKMSMSNSSSDGFSSAGDEDSESKRTQSVVQVYGNDGLQKNHFRPFPSNSRLSRNISTSRFHPSSTVSLNPPTSAEQPAHFNKLSKEIVSNEPMVRTSSNESIVPSEEENEEEDDVDEKPNDNVRLSHRSTPFVHAAYEIAMQNSPAVGFNSAGSALEIRDESLLSKEILPKYFKHNNLSSFIRQLNMYGFEKVVGSIHAVHTFQHENFRKDRPDLLAFIHRKPNKAKLEKKKSSESKSKNKFGKIENLVNAAAVATSFQAPPSQPIPSFSQHPSRTKPMPFVFATYELAMLDNDAIGFNSSGTALEIRSESKLSEVYLPKHFKHRNLSSFIRQLNMYGFEKTGKFI